MSNPVQPLRRIVQRNSHPKHGEMHELECGHSIDARGRGDRRRCPYCAPTEGRSVTPEGPVALRQWFVTNYGWNDSRVKDISKLNGWSVDRLKRPYNTDCRLIASVIDDRSFALHIANSNILRQIEGAITGVPRLQSSIVVHLPDRSAMIAVADAIENLIARPYDTPSFKFVCPKTAQRIRELYRELDSYKC